MVSTNAQGVSKSKVLAGWALRTMVTLIIAGSGIAKIAHVPKMVDGLIHAGIPQEAILPIAILELSCLALYLIPRTAVLGTFLLTGYFGGATVTHIIAGESIIPPLMIGIWVWGGAYFRVLELQELLPLRRGSEEVRASHSSIAFPAHS